jgi:hypothetical protein
MRKVIHINTKQPKADNLTLYDPSEEQHIWEDLFIGNTYAGKTRRSHETALSMLPSLESLIHIPTKSTMHTVEDDYSGNEIIIIMQDGSVGMYMIDRYSSYKYASFASLEAFAKNRYCGDDDAVEELYQSYYEDENLTKLIKSCISGVKEVLVGEL